MSKKVEVIELELLDENWQLNTKNIRKLFEDLDESESQDWRSDWKPVVYKLGAGWSVTLMEDVGGEEGGGEIRFTVIKITDKDGNETFWKIPGFYASHYGSEFLVDETFQVKPVEETIIVWKAI